MIISIKSSLFAQEPLNEAILEWRHKDVFVFQFFVCCYEYFLCIICSAEAYQSIVMLMGTQQLFTRWQGSAKVNHLEWTEHTASQVLEEWKREFTKVTAQQCLVSTLLYVRFSWQTCVKELQNQ